MLSVYSDGASSGGKNRPGGYGWVIVKDEPHRPVRETVVAWSYGGSPQTTNNLMELEGAIRGLEAALALGLDKGDAVELVSDSEYVIGIVTGAYQPTTNLESVTRLRDFAARIRGLRCRWVRGHTGDKHNEECDKLAGLGKSEHQPLEVRQLQEAKKARRTARQISRAARAAISEVPTGPGLQPEDDDES